MKKMTIALKRRRLLPRFWRFPRIELPRVVINLVFSRVLDKEEDVMEGETAEEEC